MNYRNIATVYKNEIYMKLLVVLLILAFLIPTNTSLASDDIAATIEATLASMEAGNYSAASETLSHLLKIDPNNEEVLVILGNFLLHTGHTDEAKSAFTKAVEINPDSAIGLYGLGLCSLARKDFTNALNYFRKSLIMAPDKPIESTIEYVQSVSAGFKFKPKPVQPIDFLSSAIFAFYHFKSGNLREAATIAEKSLNELQGFGEKEHTGSIAWFDPNKPLIFTAKAKVPTSLSEYNFSALPAVSGTVLLKADTSRTARPSYVVFKINGATAAIVNCEPYEYAWDTEKLVNGTYIINITSYDGFGKPIAEKEKKVSVINSKKNENPAFKIEPDPYRSDRIWKISLIKPSLWPLSYISAKQALASGNVQMADVWLEKCIALCPDRADARKLLKQIRATGERFTAISNVTTQKKLIAMTFDDGPAENTEDILDTLQEFGAKATFFLVGNRAASNPMVVKRIANEGHEIGNHTYYHRNIQLLSQREIESEVFKTSVVLRSITGRKCRLFRPPGGNVNDKIGAQLAEYGIRCVYWTFNCGTFERASAIKYREQIIRKAQPGSIFLMHNGEEVTAEALPEILDALTRKGFKFVTVSELLESK